MGNENYIQNSELQNEQMCCVSYAALHITFPYKIMEVVR